MPALVHLLSIEAPLQLGSSRSSSSPVADCSRLVSLCPGLCLLQLLQCAAGVGSSFQLLSSVLSTAEC